MTRSRVQLRSGFCLTRADGRGGLLQQSAAPHGCRQATVPGGFRRMGMSTRTGPTVTPQLGPTSRSPAAVTTRLARDRSVSVRHKAASGLARSVLAAPGPAIRPLEALPALSAPGDISLLGTEDRCETRRQRSLVDRDGPDGIELVTTLRAGGVGLGCLISHARSSCSRRG